MVLTDKFDREICSPGFSICVYFEIFSKILKKHLTNDLKCDIIYKVADVAQVVAQRLGKA